MNKFNFQYYIITTNHFRKMMPQNLVGSTGIPFGSQSYVFQNDKHDRKNVHQGSLTDRKMLNINGVVDISELRVRQGDASQYKNHNSKIVAPFEFFRIQQGDALFSKKKSPHYPVPVLSHANGINKHTYPSPAHFLDHYEFEGISDKDYAGDKTEKAMTIQKRGTFSWVTDDTINSGELLTCIPSVDYIGAIESDTSEPDSGMVALYKQKIPDLTVWPSESREVFFRWCSLDKLKRAYGYMRTKALESWDSKTSEMTFEEKLNKFIGDNKKPLDAEALEKKMTIDVFENKVPHQYYINCVCYEFLDMVMASVIAAIDSSNKLREAKSIVKSGGTAIPDGLTMQGKAVEAKFFISVVRERLKYKKLTKCYKGKAYAKALQGGPKESRIYSLLLQ